MIELHHPAGAPEQPTMKIEEESALRWIKRRRA
jgi:hypothetical protein